MIIFLGLMYYYLSTVADVAANPKEFIYSKFLYSLKLAKGRECQELKIT